MSKSPLAIALACMQAYVDKDRAAIEKLLDPDYRFTSPLDNALDRTTYFELCWPNSAVMAHFTYIHEAEYADRALIVYEATTATGKCFRNCEVHTARAGKLVTTEVYFGWDVPHQAPVGTHLEK